jgi:hypothetical protein
MLNHPIHNAYTKLQILPLYRIIPVSFQRKPIQTNSIHSKLLEKYNVTSTATYNAIQPCIFIKWPPIHYILAAILASSMVSLLVEPNIISCIKRHGGRGTWFPTQYSKELIFLHRCFNSVTYSFFPLIPLSREKKPICVCET